MNNKKETEIAKNWNMNSQPLVSIDCTTYNHERYIRDAIEGFLMQETTFPFEIIIHDDASTDDTAVIIRKYEKQYPNIIKPIYQTTNQHSTKNCSIWADITFPRARGKYIAICEGDDYWTDPLKLQKQVDFLEGHPNYSIHFHAAKHLNEKEPEKSHLHRPGKIPNNKLFKTNDVILGGGGFMTTNSMLFRAEFINKLPEWFYRSPVGDYPLMLILASKGNIGYLDEEMSVYRLMTSGSWTSDMNSSIQKIENHYRGIQRMLNDFNEWTKYRHSIYINLKKLHNLILFMYSKHRYNFR